MRSAYARFRVHLTLSLAAMTAASGLAAAADNGLAQKPLMGWTSWSHFHKHFTEATIKAQADAMAARLKPFGYSYVNIDAGWRDPSKWDDFGREFWDVSKFPNGIAPVAAYVHSKGLKLGLYLHPGMDLGTNSPFERNTPIFGTAFHARDITDSSQFGNTGKSAFRIDFSQPGSSEYIQSYADLMASWGVDYIKFDFVGPGGGTVPADDRVDMQHWLAALKNTPAGSRPIWIELSNSLSFAHAAEWRAVANGWRIDGDIESGVSGTLTKWSNVAKRFADAPKWASFAGPGGWNDFDALPIGDGSGDGITSSERRTTMTLWSIGCSPLILGADLTQLDSADLALITNSEVIAVNQAGRVATPVSQASSQQVWRVANGDGSHTVALFNLGSSTATVSAHWSDLGFSGPASVRDLWSHSELGSFNDGFSASLASHASRLLRVTPATAALSEEAEALSFKAGGAAASIQNDTKTSGGHWVQLAADGAGDFIDYTLPALPAGSYQLKLQWKGNNNRGTLSLSVDGAPLGGSLDQYSATQTYPTTTFGTLTFTSAAAHTVRLTATGRNQASSGLNLSADRFVLLPQ